MSADFADGPMEPRCPQLGPRIQKDTATSTLSSSLAWPFGKRMERVSSWRTLEAARLLPRGPATALNEKKQQHPAFLTSGRKGNRIVGFSHWVKDRDLSDHGFLILFLPGNGKLVQFLY